MKKRRVRKLAEHFAWAILALAIAVLAFVMLASRQGWEFNVILSGSMEPNLQVGGLVVLRPVDPNDVVEGDVISFYMPGTTTPTCHRVVQIGTSGGVPVFQTKGDANESPDAELVLFDYVAGRQVMHIRYLGYLGDFDRFARTEVNLGRQTLPMGFITMLAMGLIVAAFILSDAWQEVLNPSAKMRQKILQGRKMRLQNKRAYFLGDRS